MNKRLSFYLEVLTFFVGTWLFISNTLGSGSEERVAAGLGAGFVLLGFLIKEFRLKLSITRLSIFWKIIVLVFGVVGTWTFVTNTLGSGSGERVAAGLGGALIFIALYIKDINKEQLDENIIEKGISIKTALLFLLIFTMYGLHKKDFRSIISSVNWHIQSVESDLKDLEDKIDEVEDYSHYH